MVKKILIWFFSVLFSLFLLVLAWFYFYVVPNPDRMADPEKIPVKRKDGYRYIYSKMFHQTENVIKICDSSENDSAMSVFGKYKFQRADPFLNPNSELGIYDVALGKPTWEQETHDAMMIPASGKIVWSTDIPDSAELSIHFASLQSFQDYKVSQVRFKISVDNELILDTLVISDIPRMHDEKSDLYELFGQFIFIEHVKKDGFWANLKVDLKRFSGTNKKIVFTTEGNKNVPALIGNPEVWVKSKSKSKKRKNVIILQIDSLNPDIMSVNGSKLQTPLLDSLIRSGTYFENATSQVVWTRPSIHSMLTSRYPIDLTEINSFARLDYQAARALRNGYHGVYKHLNDEGYYTAFIGNNAFLTNAFDLGIDFGFDDHFDVQRDFYDAVIISEKAIRFIQENQDRDFALYLNYNTPHYTFKPPHRFSKLGFLDVVTENEHNLYEAEVTYTELELRKFLKKYYELGLDSTTVIIMNADHGVLFPHDESHKRFFPYFGIAGTIDEDRMHVPLLFTGAGIPKNQRVKGQVELIDVSPTMMSLLGFRSPDYFKGIDLTPMIKNPQVEGKEYTFEFARELRAIKWKNRWKFSRSNLPGYNIQELYDLENDPKETKNVALQYPEIVSHLYAKLNEMFRKRPIVSEFTFVNFDSNKTVNFILKSDKPVYQLGAYYTKILDTVLTIKGKGYAYVPVEFGKDSVVTFTVFRDGKPVPIWWSEGVLLSKGNELKMDYDMTCKFMTANRNLTGHEGVQVQFVPAEYWYRGNLDDAMSSTSVRDIMKTWGYIH